MKKENFKFIEEFDPVRKRRMLMQSRSLSGIIPTTKNDDGVWFESALERDFVLLLKHNPDVIGIDEQPLRIDYSDYGKLRHYTPDFLVRFDQSSGRKPWLCEIKYHDELRDKFAELKSRFKAARKLCQENGWEFKIFTDRDIRTPLLENIHFLSRYNYNDLDGACYQLVLRMMNELSITTPEEFMLTVHGADFNLKGRCLYALWYAIKLNHIGCNIETEVIDMSSEIWITEKLEITALKE